jgi:hypothetical protein
MCLPVKVADTKLLQIVELACQKTIGPTPEMQDLVREVQQLIVERLPRGQYRCNRRGVGHERQDPGAALGQA